MREALIFSLACWGALWYALKKKKSKKPNKSK